MLRCNDGWRATVAVETIESGVDAAATAAVLVLVFALFAFHKFDKSFTGDVDRKDRVFSARGTGVCTEKVRLRKILLL